MVKKAFFIVPFLFSFSLFSTPTSLSVYKAVKTHQLLFGIGENHDLLERTERKPYVNKMEELLKKMEADARAYHLLIEQAAPLSDWGKSETESDLLEDVFPLKEKLGLKRTIFEDFEKRILSKALHIIFSGPYPQAFVNNMLEEGRIAQSFQRLTFESFKCRFDTITFEDVIKELQQQLFEIYALRDSWKEEPVIRQFNEYLAHWHVVENLKNVEDFLAQFSINTKQQLVATSCEMWQTEQGRINRKRILDYFFEIGSYIIDLYLFHRVLELKEAPSKTIVIIGGRIHVSAVGVLLQKAEIFVSLESYGDYQTPLYVDSLENLMLHVEYFERIKMIRDTVNEVVWFFDRLYIKGKIAYLRHIQKQEGL